MTAALGAEESRLRDVFDIVATNDLTTLLTVICNINPFDCSPGLKCLLDRIKEGNSGINPYTVLLKELDVSAETISSSVDGIGNTPLHIAAGMGYSLVLEAILLEGASKVDAANSFGFTSLHLASRQGHLQCVKLLCDHGANPDLLTSLTKGDLFFRGRTAEFLAHWHGHHCVVEYLQEYFLRNSPNACRSSRELAESVVSPGEAPCKWVTAAKEQDISCIAKLFEELDCICCPTAPMYNLKTNPTNRMIITPKLSLETARAIILAALPLDRDMTDIEQFIFEGFLVRGYISSTPSEEKPQDALSFSSYLILKRVIHEGHMGALRAMCQYGLRRHCLTSLASKLMDELTETTPQRLIPVKSILSELVASVKYEQTLQAYRQKPQSLSRKEKAWSAKCAMRKMQKELTRIGVKPLTFSM